MSRFLSLIKKVGDLVDILNPLMELARNFRGFTAFGAFALLIGLVVVILQFPQGSFNVLLDGFKRLESGQFFQFALAALAVFTTLSILLLVLAYLHSTRTQAAQSLISVVVCSDDSERRPIRDALVMLTLDNETFRQHTDDVGGTTFRLGRVWRQKRARLNAEHTDYAARDPLIVDLKPGEQIAIPLQKKDRPALPEAPLPLPLPTPGDKSLPTVYISYADSDAATAATIADRLRQSGFPVWPVGATEDRNEIDLGTEQTIRRADIMMALVSGAAETSPRLTNEANFAHTTKIMVVPVKIEPDVTIPPMLKGPAHNDGQTSLEINPRNLLAEVDRLSDELRSIGAAPVENVVDPTKPTQPSAKTLPRPPAKTSPKGDRPPANPFVHGGVVRDDLFIGRREALAKISNRIGGVTMQSVSIVANRRMGKTSLLHYVQRRHRRLFQTEGGWSVVYVDMMDARAHDNAGIMRLLRRAIAGRIKRDPWAEKYDGDLSVMAEAFEDMSADGVNLVLCLDEWEEVMAHPELDALIEQLRASGSMCRIGMVVATAYELIDLKRASRLGSPFYNIFDTVYLGLMPDEEWQGLVQAAYERGGRPVEPKDMALIGSLAGGHPYLTQLAGSLVWEAPWQGRDTANICQVYKHKARALFGGIWSRQNEAQKAAIREALGIHMADPIARDVWDDLKRRGVLTEGGEVFCQPFADFVMSQEL